MASLGIIPARAASVRFPNKILAPILGKPMVQHVWEQAAQSKCIDTLLIATDSQEIAQVCGDFGARVVMTSPACRSGSERVYEVSQRFAADQILSIQGDEPLINPEDLDRIVRTLQQHPGTDICTLAERSDNPHWLQDRNVVKVVVNRESQALYFSRQALRCETSGEFLRHIGIYGYQAHALKQWNELGPSVLEQVERLEQLRALESGMTIEVLVTTHHSIGVDTPQDLEQVENYLRMHSSELVLGQPPS